MIKAKEACLGLLAEIQNICDENGLRVYLIDKQLWAAQKNGIILGYEADVAMFYDDFERFRMLASEKHGDSREIESYEDNASLPGIYYRYVDAGSTFFNLDDIKLFRKHGMFVNIHIIRSSGKSQNALAVYEWAMGKGLHKSRRAMLYGGLVGGMCILTGKEKQKKKILELFEGARVEKDGKTEIKLPLGKRLVFPAGFWNRPVRCNLSGYELTTVRQPDKYLKLQYGSDWADKNIKGKQETYMCVFCKNLPYVKYWEYAGDDILNEEFFSKRGKYMNSLKENIKDYNKQTRQAWNMFYSIDEHFRIQDRSKDYKDAVMSAWDADQHDRAVMLMSDYAEKIDEYRKKKVALIADEDMWNLYIEWLLENGRDGIAGKLQSYVKEGQLKEVSAGDQTENS